MLANDELNGRPHRVVGPDAEAFLEKFRRDVALAKKNGWDIDIPHEIEVGGT